ncbi:molybdenum cofactor biosynthesis protein MoaE [Williamsia sp.]|uniref:molybdenum cofactor biosynthesis protein MoaE n=1 Tax=Williamsia sp. TaxID=1872085 RepID=UPI001A2419ED|nr:molybdenum cofactor biosynthesis protein MoaE [Williamsia sp.]MBJ7288007.1 molybdenum cofactor biosynthesis protein MoaE [Williamsia sp.]
MSAVVVRAVITEDPLDVGEHRTAVEAASDGAAGAVVDFVGAVRNHDGGRDVGALHYTAHPSAGEVIARVVADVAESSDGVRAVAVSHRVGDLEIGDAALVVSVAADHRGAAFATCARMVDEVKDALPVWKHQIFADGSDEWVGSA